MFQKAFRHSLYQISPLRKKKAFMHGPHNVPGTKKQLKHSWYQLSPLMERRALVHDHHNVPECSKST